MPYNRQEFETVFSGKQVCQPKTPYKWIENVEEILFSIGRPDLWINQDHIPSSTISKQVKVTLIDQYKQSWSGQLQESNKVRTYFSFKPTHNFETYLQILDFTDAYTLFKFRTANFKLPVELLKIRWRTLR